MGNRHKNGTRDVERLVEASRSGNRGAFDNLVRLYQRRVTYLAIRLLGNVDDATEIVQEAFVIAYLRIDKLRDSRRFEPWLLKIVTNLAIDHRHTIQHRSKTMEVADYCEAKSIVSPVEKEIGTELEEAIRRAMLKLSKKEAQAISLFGLENLSHQEVAAIMGCSVGSVRWYVFRARRKLSVLLKDYM